MARPARATVNLDALRHNCAHAKRLAGGARTLAVIKADGYGHGAVAAARALAGLADAFGVACVEEAVELREAGVHEPIVLLEGFFDAGELALVQRLGLWTVVHTEAQVRALLAARLDAPVTVWLKMDSGMHRLGIAPDRYRDAHQRLSGSPGVGEIVLMTHFARADELDCDYTRVQLERFEAATDGLPGLRSVANSPAVLGWPAARAGWIRPGMMLYGASPLDRPTPEGDALRPVMTLASELIAVHALAAGEPVGYGGRFRCERPMRVGVVALGYADGYPRGAADGTPVAVKGRRTRLVGRVSMDMVTVDLTGLDDARVGDAVELWGPQVPLNEVAAACGTIAYELVARMPRRVPRIPAG